MQQAQNMTGSMQTCPAHVLWSFHEMIFRHKLLGYSELVTLDCDLQEHALLYIIVPGLVWFNAWIRKERTKKRFPSTSACTSELQLCTHDPFYVFFYLVTLAILLSPLKWLTMKRTMHACKYESTNGEEVYLYLTGSMWSFSLFLIFNKYYWWGKLTFTTLTCQLVNAQLTNPAEKITNFEGLEPVFHLHWKSRRIFRHLQIDGFPNRTPENARSQNV